MKHTIGPLRSLRLRASALNRFPVLRRWRLWRALGLLIVAGAWALLLVNAGLAAATSPYRFDDVPAMPKRGVAIIFGAGLIDGRPSPALADRVRGGVELYHSGRVRHLLMSGDNSQASYDEVTAMRDYAIGLGVPAAAITRDYAGFSTYETCYRARAIFGVGDAVLVTQGYHLPRAVYTCRALGIDALGLAIPDWAHHPERSATSYGLDQQVVYSLREWLAGAKALAQLHLTRPSPTFLGPFEGLTGR
jgi:vancomycin permeability regulator SanA